METNCKYLLIYGTLLSIDNEYGNYLQANSRYISPGRFNGLLYDLGDYPGASYQPESIYHVYGVIVLLNNSDVFKKLDEYEGYGEGQPQPWLYIRQIIPVETDNGIINCQVYLYNLPVDDYPQIASGRYQ